MLILVLLSPTSTLTFYSVSGKAQDTLITFTTTALLILLSPGCHVNHCIQTRALYSKSTLYTLQYLQRSLGTIALTYMTSCTCTYPSDIYSPQYMSMYTDVIIPVLGFSHLHLLTVNIQNFSNSSKQQFAV